MTTFSVFDSAVDARRESEGVCLLLRANHNNADAVLADASKVFYNNDNAFL